jgi:hypothetical protein
VARFKQLVRTREQKGPGELGLSSMTDQQKEAAWRVEFRDLASN